MRTFYARRPRVVDLFVAGRVFNACWFSASLGISMLQMRLLAQAWQLSHLAVIPACLMSLWTLGSLSGLRTPNTSRVWGFATLTAALLWLGGPSLALWHLPLSMVPQPLLNIAALALVAAVLGASSSAWLAQQRAWPAAGERTTLARTLVGLTAGLVVVWMLPAWAGLLVLACCLPLLLLDARFSGRAPLPRRGDLAAAWMRRYWQVEQQLLQLEQQGALPGGWYWKWLAERSRSSSGYLSLTLLASGVAVVLASVWGAVPTPFAAGLAVTHSLEKLGWLLGGQLIVVLPGACLLLLAARGVIGFSDRLVPPAWQARARFLAAVAPPGMAAALVALGLPSLQAPWWLAASLVAYTLASAVWGLLLPRVRPAFATQARAERHVWLGQGKALPAALQMAHAAACERQVNRLLATIEGVLVAVFTPLLGWLIDMCGSVDPVLVGAGLSLLAALVAGVAAASLVRVARRRARSPRLAAASAGRYMAYPVSLRRVRPAW